MTLIEVIDAARSILNEPLDSARSFPDNTSGFWTDNILMTYHNMVQQEIQQELIQTFEDFFVTQTNISIVNGTAEYNLPSDFVKLRRVEDIRQSPPAEILPVSLNHREVQEDGYLASAGEGRYYLRGTQIVLTDTPAFTNASAVRLHYIKRLADVTASTSTSEIPTEHHRLLIWGIVKLALHQQQSDTGMAEREYERHIARMKQQAEDRQLQRPRKVVRTYERGTI